MKRLWRRLGYILFGAVLGAVVQELTVAPRVPVIGLVIGGLFFLGLHEAFKAE